MRIQRSVLRSPYSCRVDAHILRYPRLYRSANWSSSRRNRQLAHPVPLRVPRQSPFMARRYVIVNITLQVWTDKVLREWYAAVHQSGVETMS